MSDYTCLNEPDVKKAGDLFCIGVNLLGEPGKVAFFENCRVRDLTNGKGKENQIGSFKTGIKNFFVYIFSRRKPAVCWLLSSFSMETLRHYADLCHYYKIVYDIFCYAYTIVI